MLNFMIVVDDGGELKSVSSAEVSREISTLLEAELNGILDDRAIAAGEYTPEDNDTPMIVGFVHQA